ncbi:MAG: LemA family protein [Nanoarchaeota archaeon]
MAVGTSVIIWTIVALALTALIGYIIAIFNGLIQLKNNIKKAWSNIDVLLKQRTDELPNLVNAVKGYMKHEKEVLNEITKARTAILNAKTMSEKAKADNIITNALKTIFAVAENYPKLRANENFMQLQERITGLENEIADRREFYNDSVTAYNIRIQSIPDIMVAKMMSYKAEELFKAGEEEKNKVDVQI